MKKTRAIEILTRAMRDAEKCAACIASEEDYDKELLHDLEEEAEAFRMAIYSMGGSTA